jgi:hypothetical protein
MRKSQTKYSICNKLLLMQSKATERSSKSTTAQVDRLPRIFKFYEEYSKTDIFETVKTRRAEYDSATLERKIELQSKVDEEVRDFGIWLKDSKHLEPSMARYSSIALKSVLLGLPTGEQIAQLFSIVLDSS